MRRSVLLMLTLVLLLTFTAAASASPRSFTIQVQASGVVTVPPTKAQLWVGAKSDGQTAQEALGQSNEAVERLLEVFSKYTAPELVKTSEFTMYQNEQWDEETGQFVPTGFSVRHVFEVQILDLTRVAAFLDEATQAGANIIYGLSYGVQDYRRPKEEAFKRAMDEVWWKAGIIAEANSAQELILEAVEETYYYGTDYSSMGLEAMSAQEGSFAPGQLQITATVSATFRAYLPEE
ncbi:MAG: SIMPL domain-containing protein [Limnochordia bacterium]|jgi:uncharacterized protein YggE|nr:SIMPL domain-containing protein [Limnochordia bacterium]MDI9465486.1 SIMPL domain-containing protein [Bacillota bacterium]NLO95106.1 SIMPL domain-containing protein [Bacillota bacterium]HAN95490.1 hypothetical protein [Bacillota bacterium]HOB41378.1 SIMPL domain-containing protein [Limnochordia bacterium]